MPRTSERTLTQLEWYTITYRSVGSYVLWVVLLLAVAITAFYWLRVHLPRARAESAIAVASESLGQAEPLADAEVLRKIVAHARSALEEARAAYAAKEFGDARFSALRSADLSNQALETARGNQTDTKMVRFSRLEGDVRVKHAGEFSWEAASGQTKLGIGDQVKTSSSASAQLIYFDGTVTTIQPGSLLEIRDLYEDPVTKVRRVKEKLTFGEVNASTQRRNVRGSYHEVTTEKLTARTEDAGEFRVGYDRKKKKGFVDSFQGQVVVDTGSRKESLVAGERLRMDNGKVTAKESLPGVPRLMSPADQRVYIFENPAEHQIALAWQAVPGAAKYHLVIADQPLFTNPLYDAERTQTEAQLEVGPGTYYWKVAAVNRAGVEGPSSDLRAFRVSSQKIKDRDDQEPPALEITEFVTVGMMVILNGRTEPGATLWVDNERVDINDDGRFYAVVRLGQEGVNDLLVRAQDTAGNETRVTRSAYVEMF